MPVMAANSHLGTARTLNREAVYDYNYAAATRTYGAALWMDVRDAADCPRSMPTGSR
jgi:hypothetical protein